MVNTVLSLFLAGIASLLYVKLVLPVARKLESQKAEHDLAMALLKASIDSLAKTNTASLGELAKAVRSVTDLAQKLGEGHTTLAIEQGRQAERLHYLSNEISKTQLGLEHVRRRHDDPK